MNTETQKKGRTPRARSSGSRSRWIPWLLVLPGVLFYILAFVIPQTRLLAESVDANGSLGLGEYESVLGDAYGIQIVLRSLGIAAMVAIFTALLGFPLAYQLARSTSRWKGLLLAVSLFPLLASAVVRTFGWQVMFYRTGPINAFLQLFGVESVLIGTSTGVIIALVEVLLPYMVITLHLVIKGIPVSLEEAAQDLGDSPARAFFRVVVPLAKGGLLAGTLLVFSLAVSTYVTPALIGGARVQVLATEIYQQAISLLNFPRASALAVVLLLVSIVVVALQSKFLSNKPGQKSGS